MAKQKSIAELKERREVLWTSLNKLLADHQPKEDKIRKEIRAIQEELYKREMTPVMLTLQNKETLSEREQEKLTLLESVLG